MIIITISIVFYQNILLFSGSDDDTGPIPRKRLRSCMPGPSLYDKDLCVWCGKPADERHPNRKYGKLYRITQKSSWHTFKRHPVFLEDEEKRERMTRVVNAVLALSDPFAADLMYHHNCWRENIDNISQKSTHLQNVTLKEARSLFFKHVDDVILERTILDPFSNYFLIIKILYLNMVIHLGI